MREKKAKDAYNRRYEASIKDELTGLYNRRGFEVDCEIIKKNNKNLSSQAKIYATGFVNWK